MDKPIVFLSIFVAMGIILLGLLILTPKQQTQLSVNIIDTSLTQSLDGQRRFVTVTLKDHEPDKNLVLSVPNHIDCSNSKQATIGIKKDLFNRSNYQFISCP